MSKIFSKHISKCLMSESRSLSPRTSNSCSIWHGSRESASRRLPKFTVCAFSVRHRLSPATENRATRWGQEDGKRAVSTSHIHKIRTIAPSSAKAVPPQAGKMRKPTNFEELKSDTYGDVNRRRACRTKNNYLMHRMVRVAICAHVLSLAS